MREILSHYRRIPAPVLRFIAAEQALNIVNIGMFVVFNLYLRGLGHDDASIARITSYRFLCVLLLALPAGLYIRGRRLKPLFLLAAVVVPLTTLGMLAAAAAGAHGWLSVLVFMWGFGMMTLHVANLPFIMRETSPEAATEAISLSFSTFPLAMVGCGLLVPVLRAAGLDDGGILAAMAGLGLLAVPLVLGIVEREPPADDRPLLERGLASYDWALIGRAAVPNMAIAIGAGLTIPFINLFFNTVFGFDTQNFSMLAGATGLLVLVGSLLNPAVRRRFGYRVAILLSQSLAVLFLVLLSLTELWQHVPGMVWLAALCYMLRQPLMNMAAPITSELTMSYAGPRNRELVAALHASIWSGSWFVSAKLFQLLRAAALPYWKIFLVTSGLYVLGIVLYALLIRDHERRQSLASSVESAATR